jgi:Bacterial Ig-like domain (group 2)
MLTGRKLPLTLAFTVLVAVAFGISCRGFFPKPVLQSISIQPPSPQVEVGSSLTLQAWGTYDDGTRSQITSGVAWTSSGQNATVDVDPNTGAMTGVDLGGTATITASAQALSATASATAYLGTVTGFEACMGSFDTTSCPNPAWQVNQSGGTQTFNAQATYNKQQIDLTKASTWTPSSSAITCDSTSTPASCQVTSNTTANTYTITVTYGTNNSATFDVKVTNP